MRLAAVRPGASGPWQSLLEPEQAPPAARQITLGRLQPDHFCGPGCGEVEASEEGDHSSAASALLPHRPQQSPRLVRAGDDVRIEFFLHRLRQRPPHPRDRVVGEELGLDGEDDRVVEDGSLPADGVRGGRGAVQLPFERVECSACDHEVGEGRCRERLGLEPGEYLSHFVRWVEVPAVLVERPAVQRAADGPHIGHASRVLHQARRRRGHDLRERPPRCGWTPCHFISM